MTNLVRIFLCIILTLTIESVQSQTTDLNTLDNAVYLEPLEPLDPQFPSNRVRRGQEGWVRFSFVVTPDGKAVDPVILDSVGGCGFEAAVLESISDWRFAATGEEWANQVRSQSFNMAGGRDRATSNFLRRYKRVMQHLAYEQTGDARKAVDSALEVGGWNLYESTMLWLMVGRVEGAEGNKPGKLESYRRALGVSNRNSLRGDDLRDLLARIFDLEMELSQYAGALRTLNRLRDEPGSEKELAERTDTVAELERMLSADEPLRASAILYSSCDSENSQSLWAYVPARPTFSFAALSGNVERFEVRCEHSRLRGLIEVDKTWSLPEKASNCQVFVFGEDGASFQFIEHASADADSVTEKAAVARSDVLD